MAAFLIVVRVMASSFRNRRALALENLALRHQLSVLQRTAGRPRLRWRDRLLWVLLARTWRGWRESLTIVQPETVIRWHREGFRRHWNRKSRAGRPGRPGVSREIRSLIREMSGANPLWGAPRIHGELRKLGIEVSQGAVSKYMVRRPRPPSQSWRTFLENHAGEIASIDFFTVPTATFRVLYVLLVLGNRRRQILHLNVTASPSARWTVQQMVEAFPWDSAPKYLLRDRDRIYGGEFVLRVQGMGIEQLVTRARSPWQNAYVERVIGSIRRECLDHVVILNEKHLRRVLRDYVAYYHESRTHLGLSKDCPIPRPIEPPARGPIRREPVLGGLHHRYFRRAA